MTDKRIDIDVHTVIRNEETGILQFRRTIRTIEIYLNSKRWVKQYYHTVFENRILRTWGGITGHNWCIGYFDKI